MPAVTEEAKRRVRATKRTSSLRHYIEELMKAKNVGQKECAEALGMKSQQSFSYAINHMSFKVPELIALLDYLGADQPEVAYILARGTDEGKRRDSH